jgi:hypothetical protein
MRQSRVLHDRIFERASHLRLLRSLDVCDLLCPIVSELFVTSRDLIVGFFVNSGALQLGCNLVVEDKNLRIVVEEPIDI